MHRNSAKLRKILKGLDPQVKERAKSRRVVVEGYKEKIRLQPVQFTVGDHEVTLKAKGSQAGNPDLFISCSCEYWKYYGPEHHAKRGGYLYGTPRGTAQKPVIRDPKGTHKLCVHAYAVLRDLFEVELS